MSIKLKTEVHYIDISVAELGFPICAVLEEIYAAGLKLKYKLCPAEVGPESCLQQMPVPDKRVYIAMKDILDPEFPKLGGTSRIFMVNCNAGKYALASQNGDLRLVHGSEDRFRFLCKR
jgi:hypothetical protein